MITHQLNQLSIPKQADLHHRLELSPEPSPDDKDSILIGVTLPDGQKFHRHFLLSDVVQKVIDFASIKANTDFKLQNCKLLERPKKILDNFKMTIEHYQLHNRTMLIVIHDEDLH
jgi:hypothetical protein